MKGYPYASRLALLTPFMLSSPRDFRFLLRPSSLHTGAAAVCRYCFLFTLLFFSSKF